MARSANVSLIFPLMVLIFRTLIGCVVYIISKVLDRRYDLGFKDQSQNLIFFLCLVNASYVHILQNDCLWFVDKSKSFGLPI